MRKSTKFVPACIPPSKTVISDKENLFVSECECQDLSVNRIGHMIATPLQFYASFFERTDYCIQYVVKGEGDFFANNRLYKLKKNTLFLLPKRNYHYYCANKDNPYEYLWVHFSGKTFEKFLEEMGLSEFNPVLYNVVNPSVEKRFHELLALCRQDVAQNKYLILGKGYQLLHEFSKTRDTAHSQSKQSENTRIDEIIEYINANYREDLSLDFLANKFFIDKYYLVKQFKKFTSLTPIQYLIQYRIGAAATLLGSTSQSINEIAEQCGFHTQTNFLLRFKEVFGVSPSDYRKSLKLSSSKGKKQS